MSARATIPAEIIDAARAVRIEDELKRRHITLTKTSGDLVGPCPVCGGTDRFAVSTKKQLWNCRHCRRGGNVIALVTHIDGCSFIDAVELLSGKQVELTAGKEKGEDNDEQRTTRALAIWREARDPRGTLVERYFAHRGLVLLENAAGEAIRFHPACPFGGTRTRTPALVALVRDVITNELKAIHRTAIHAGGRKAWIDGKDRLALGPVGGGAVKLTPDENVTLCLGIGEGIESTLSMHLVPEFGDSPVWALLSAGQVARFPALAGIEALWIAVDHDTAGIKAARECAARWRKAGREVFLVTPRADHADLNDLVGAA